MSDSKQGGGEPSMEEILASIRKIISEDTAQDGQASSAGDGDEPSAKAGSGGAEADDAAGGAGDDVLELSDAAEDMRDDADGADDAPLDLTEEVEQSAGDADLDDGGRDDGGSDDEAPLELDEQVDGDAATAVEAQSAADGFGADSAADDPFGGDGIDAEPAGDDLGGLDGAGHEADAGLAGAIDGDDGAHAGSADSVGDPADDTAMLADPFDDMGAGPDTAETAAADTAAEAALAAGAMAGVGGAAAGAGGASAKRSKDTASPLGPEDQRVISDSAEQQAVEQLTSLARQAENAPNDTTADNVDHILARMVRDALRPQLREWMDRNLPQIVERIVREEVQRMTRRAQGLDDDSRY